MTDMFSETAIGKESPVSYYHAKSAIWAPRRIL